jgi:aspartate/methionine/tyrosine aminotransferase
MCGARIGCIVSKKQRANGHRNNEICTSAIEPSNISQVASEAALDTSKLF